ncbi:MAG: HD domain-containing protein [Caldilineaceae bacterium]|nr:HD domain-containing protein [Caldilineaceae bacterium]
MAMKLKRGKKTTIIATNAGWRTVCRRHAEQRATDEALDDWKAKSDKAVPFNYRWEHVQIVVGLALHLADLTGADREITEAAAWLHDICKGEPNHGAAGARAARILLEHTDFPAAKIDAVALAISLHVGLQRPPGAPPLQPLEAAVLWDADKLSKLGVQALAYNLGMSFMRGLTLPQRRANLREFTESVLIRTVASMNTPEAGLIAQQRYEAMLAMLALWEREEENIP